MIFPIMEEFVPLNVYLMKQEYMIDEKKKL